MCLVLDTNAFGPCFDAGNREHQEFRPVLEWVTHGKGKLVYGGTKYKKEMKSARKFLRFFATLDRAGKTVKLVDINVDQLEVEVKNIEPSRNFDDPHLIAIVLESSCRIICTSDARAIPYIKDPRFYTNGVKKPKIYTSSKNISLLADKYIAEICNQSVKLPKKDANRLFGP
jgi:predicted DNA binding protein